MPGPRWTDNPSRVGDRSWAKSDISWGIWGIPESQLNALGDLAWFAGKDCIELGCGTAYFSAWLARLGAKPVGIDLTPVQIETAKSLQEKYGLHFPLIEGNAEHVPLPNSEFDFAISEYGASIWCDPYKWIPEAARLLKPGGRLVFLRNSTIATLCSPDRGTTDNTLKRPLFGMHRIEWQDDENAVEFHLPLGDLVRLLVQNSFVINNVLEIQAPADAKEPDHYEYMNCAWAQQWPSEEIWVVTKQN